MDVPDLAVLEERRRDEQAVVGRLLHERHDGRETVRQAGELSEARVIEAHGDLCGQVLELVAGQAELGKDDEVGARLARACEQVPMVGEVLVERSEARSDLGECDTGGLHVPEHTEATKRSPRACHRAASVTSRDVDARLPPTCAGPRGPAGSSKLQTARTGRQAVRAWSPRGGDRKHVPITEEVVDQGRDIRRVPVGRLRRVRYCGDVAECQRPRVHRPIRRGLGGCVRRSVDRRIRRRVGGASSSAAASASGGAFTPMVYPTTGDAPCGVAPYTGNMKKITAVDELTVEFQLCNPDASFLPKVAFSAFGIQDSDYLTKHVPDGTILTQPNGTGPLRLQGMEQGQPDRLDRQPRLLGRQGQDPDGRAPLERRIGRPAAGPPVRHRRRHRQPRHPGYHDDQGRQHA